MDNAFKYIKANGGIDTEESYPYEGVDETCRYSSLNIGATDTGASFILLLFTFSASGRVFILMTLQYFISIIIITVIPALIS